jgi:threonine dehydrogenase-like Zn-dependent dehydrogenase
MTIYCMRAVVLDSGGVRFDANRPRPAPAEGEVRVRVLRAGICETDLQLVGGYMGFQGVLGHEFVGIAEEGPLKGERVVGEINCGCGTCSLCRGGLGNHCPHRSVLGILNRDGAFADYLALPQQNLHRVPDGVSTDEATFTEPLAAAFQIPAQLPVEAGRKVIVLGDGRLGNLCAQVIRLHGPRVIVIGKHDAKLALLDRLGIETTLLKDVNRERTADVVVDCTGSASGLPMAMQLVKPRGTILLKTTVAGEQTLKLAPLVIDEVTVVGSRCGPFAAALQALQERRINVEPLISVRYPLDEAVTALEQARRTPVLKVLLDVAADAETGSTHRRKS